MPDWEYPIEALKNAVEEELEAIVDRDGGAIAHYFGERELARNARPPRYVWVPTRGRDRNATPTRAVDEYRTLFSTQEHVEVWCFGRTFAEAHALRNNLLRAVHLQAEADVDLESQRWERPSAAVNQDGECVVVEFSLAVPFIDAFVAITECPLQEPAVSYAELEAVEGALYNSPDTETNGELGLTVTTEDP